MNVFLQRRSTKYAAALGMALALCACSSGPQESSAVGSAADSSQTHDPIDDAVTQFTVTDVSMGSTGHFYVPVITGTAGSRPAQIWIPHWTANQPRVVRIVDEETLADRELGSSEIQIVIAALQQYQSDPEDFTVSDALVGLEEAL